MTAKTPKQPTDDTHGTKEDRRGESSRAGEKGGRKGARRMSAGLWEAIAGETEDVG